MPHMNEAAMGGNQAPAQAMPAAPDQAMPQNPMAPMLAQGLAKLSPAELQELDTYITPRLHEILTKAFGPEVGALLERFIQDDEMAEASMADMEGEPMGPEAIPYSNTPIRQVKAMGY